MEPRLLVTADVLPGAIAETALLAAVGSQTTLLTVLAMRSTTAVWTSDYRSLDIGSGDRREAARSEISTASTIVNERIMS